MLVPFRDVSVALAQPYSTAPTKLMQLMHIEATAKNVDTRVMVQTSVSREKCLRWA